MEFQSSDFKCQIADLEYGFRSSGFKRGIDMNSDEMRARTKDFALRVIRLVTALPEGRVADILGRQLLRSGTSVGANYREALRGSSRKQFIYSTEIALREADETLYWLELIAAAEIMPAPRLSEIMRECRELVAILAATVRTSKRNSAEATKTRKRPPQSEI